MRTADSPVFTRPPRGQLWPAFYVLGVFLGFGALFALLDRDVRSFITLATLGLAIGGSFFAFALVKPRRKRWPRRIGLWLTGLSLFLGAGVFGRQSFQLEGFWFHLLHGVLGGVVMHYLVAKILGPIFFGRAWCGWGCWTWMVLELLPYPRGRHPTPLRASGVRLLHFALSLGLVLLLWFGVGYRHGTEWKTTHGLYWFLAGNALYYLVGIALAFALKDNRAFCKTLCPVSVLLRTSGRLSLLRVEGKRSACDACGACTKACPMEVDVMAHVLRDERVRDPECTLCQSCIVACARGALALSLRAGRLPAASGPRS